MDENTIIDPKLAETLKRIWDSFTDEQKERAEACETPDELTAFAREQDIELPDEVLSAVAGGGFRHIRWDFGPERRKRDDRRQMIEGVWCIKCDKVEFPCPRCYSWNVENFDPEGTARGTIGWKMRIKCLEKKTCGYQGPYEGPRK